MTYLLGNCLHFVVEILAFGYFCFLKLDLRYFDAINGPNVSYLGAIINYYGDLVGKIDHYFSFFHLS